VFFDIGSLPSSFVASSSERRGRRLSVEEVRSLRTWLLPSACDARFVVLLKFAADVEPERSFKRGIRLRDVLQVFELSETEGLPLRIEGAGEGLGCETQSSDRESSQRSIVSVNGQEIVVGGLQNSMMRLNPASD